MINVTYSVRCCTKVKEKKYHALALIQAAQNVVLCLEQCRFSAVKLLVGRLERVLEIVHLYVFNQSLCHYFLHYFGEECQVGYRPVVFQCLTIKVGLLENSLMMAVFKVSGRPSRRHRLTVSVISGVRVSEQSFTSLVWTGS